MPSSLRHPLVVGCRLANMSAAAKCGAAHSLARVARAERHPLFLAKTRGPNMGWLMVDTCLRAARRVLPLLPGGLPRRFASGTPGGRRSEKGAAIRGGMTEGQLRRGSSNSKMMRGGVAAADPRSSPPSVNVERDGRVAAGDGGDSGSKNARPSAGKGKQARTGMDTADQIKLNKIIMGNESLPHLAKLCASDSHKYDAVNTAAAIGRISKLIVKQKLYSHADHDAVARAVRSLGRRAVDLMDSFQPRQINALLGAHAKLAKYNLAPSGELMDAVRGRAIERIEGFAPMHTSHTMWALSALVPHGGEQQLVVALCRRAMATMTDFKEMEVPSMLLGIARLGVVHDKLLSGLVDQAKAYAKDMSPQALANTLWSFAKMEYHPGNEAMSSMVNVAGEKIVGFNAQNISNLVWSLGKLQCPPGTGLDDKLGKRIVETAETFSAQGIANTLSGYAMLQTLPSKDALHALATQSTLRITGFTAQAVCTTMRSMAVLRALGSEQEHKMWSHLCRQAQVVCSDMTLSGVSSLLESLGSSPTLPRQYLIEQLFKRVSLLKDDFDAVNIASFLRGVVAVRAMPPDDILEAIYLRAWKSSWTPHDAESALEALGALQLRPSRDLIEHLQTVAKAASAPAVDNPP